MNKELLALCKQTITRYAYQTRDDHNDKTWSSMGTTIACRIENQDVMVRDNNGQEVVSTCQIYCNGTTTIALKDRITSADFAAPYPVILKIDKQVDENGAADHVVIYTR